MERLRRMVRRLLPGEQTPAPPSPTPPPSPPARVPPPTLEQAEAAGPSGLDLAQPPTDGPKPRAAWRLRIDALIARITGNRYVVRVLGVMSIANEAGATLFAAALAFSTMFAVIPLVLLLAGVLGWLVEDPIQRRSLLDQLIGYVPPLADFFATSLEGVVRGRGALSIVGVVGLLWGASAYYGGLDEVMRRIFAGGGIRGELSRRARGVITIVVLVAIVLGTISLSGLWAMLDRLVGGLEIFRFVIPVLALAIMALVVLAVYVLVPTAPPSVRAALAPAIVAGLGIGVLTNLFSVLAPWLIGGLSGFGVIATVFGALIWLNFSYQILLYGAAWARLRRDREREQSDPFRGRRRR
jgi:membrane protein